MFDGGKQIPTRVRAILVVASLSLTSGSVAAAADATAVLERAREAYAKAGPFRETIDFQLRMPDGAISTRRQEYGVGGTGAAFMRLSADGREGLRVVASEGRVLALWAHIGARMRGASCSTAAQ
jgi:hypothetical protein